MSSRPPHVDLCALSVTQMAAGIREGDFTSAELVTAHVAAVEATDRVLGAVVWLDGDRAVASARAADAARTAGAELGPLHGVPFTVKAQLDVASMPTSEASLLLRDRVATHDDVAVERLRAAGAVPLGKTNMSELAMFPDSVNRVFGATRNPHAADRSAGGSSGGEASAIAAHLSPFGVGSDYGGSIRCPAHFCGIAGLRPGVDALPAREPALATMPVRRALSTVGPLARSIQDLELVATSMLGCVGPAPLPRSAIVFVDELRRPVAPACLEALGAAATLLESRGVAVDEAVPPFQVAAEQLFTLLTRNETRIALEPLLQGRMDRASPQLAVQWEAVADEDPGLHEGALDDLRRVAARAARWLEEHPVLLAPPAASAAFPLGTLDGVFELFAHCTLASALGLPAAVVPARAGSDGLPVGVQVIGRRGHEAEVLAVAAVLESGLK